MYITLLCVGKIKEKYWQQAIDEYAKRLGKYHQFKIVAVADEKDPAQESEKAPGRLDSGAGGGYSKDNKRHCDKRLTLWAKELEKL